MGSCVGQGVGRLAVVVTVVVVVGVVVVVVRVVDTAAKPGALCYLFLN